MMLKQLIALVIRVDYEDRGMWRQPSVRKNDWDWKYWCTEKGQLDLLGLAGECEEHRLSHPRVVQSRPWQMPVLIDETWSRPAYMWLMTDIWLMHAQLAWHFLRTHGIDIDGAWSDTKPALKLLRVQGPLIAAQAVSAPVLNLAMLLREKYSQGLPLVWSESTGVSQEAWNLGMEVFIAPSPRSDCTSE